MLYKPILNTEKQMRNSTPTQDFLHVKMFWVNTNITEGTFTFSKAIKLFTVAAVIHPSVRGRIYI